MIASFSQKIELRFWDMVIGMLTGSPLMGRLVGWMVRTWQNTALRRKIAIGVVIACAGFATGILAFTVAALL